MTTQAPSSRHPEIRFLRKRAFRQEPRGGHDLPRIDPPYDLTGNGYRVVLGCCSQTDLDESLATGRLASAKPKTTIPVKEVKS